MTLTVEMLRKFLAALEVFALLVLAGAASGSAVRLRRFKLLLSSVVLILATGVGPAWGNGVIDGDLRHDVRADVQRARDLTRANLPVNDVSTWWISSAPGRPATVPAFCGEPLESWDGKIASFVPQKPILGDIRPRAEANGVPFVWSPGTDVQFQNASGVGLESDPLLLGNECVAGALGRARYRLPAGMALGRTAIRAVKPSPFPTRTLMINVRPRRPTDLRARHLSHGVARLDWTRSLDDADITMYQVRRSDPLVGGYRPWSAPTAEIPAGTTSLTDHVGATNAIVCYQIRAIYRQYGVDYASGSPRKSCTVV